MCYIIAVLHRGAGVAVIRALGRLGVAALQKAELEWEPTLRLPLAPPPDYSLDLTPGALGTTPGVVAEEPA